MTTDYRFHFDGSTYAVIDPILFSETDSWTVEVTISYTGNSEESFDFFFGERGTVGNAFILRPRISAIGFRASDGYYTATADIELGKEFIFTATYQNGLFSFYVNGQKMAEEQYPTAVVFDTIGYGYRNNNYMHQGTMRKLKVWNTSRSEDVIQANLLSSNPDNPTYLIANWEMTEGTGNTFFDSSVTGNHGTIAMGNLGWKLSNFYGNNLLTGGFDRIEDIQFFDGFQQRPVIVKVMTPEGLKDFFRPINFHTDFATAENMSLQTAETLTSESLNAGSSIIPVRSIVGFTVGEVVTITDGINEEHTLITAISTNSLSVNALLNAYPRNSIVARSTAKINGAFSYGTRNAYTIEEV